MGNEEDLVIDGVSRGQLSRAEAPRAVTPGGETPARADPVARPVPVLPVTGPVSVPVTGRSTAALNLGGIARELAASPPVDSARVQTLRNAIVSGSYQVDPTRIAAAMIALETVPPKG